MLTFSTLIGRIVVLRADERVHVRQIRLRVLLDEWRVAVIRGQHRRRCGDHRRGADRCRDRAFQ